jgi:NAD(P)-dependent dehydrogenase (short-subunit alcohol dehydrogenase family)
MINPFDITGKTILITGASSGIGKEIAIQCSNMGANIIAVGRNTSRLLELTSNQNGISTYQCDLSDDVSVSKLVDTIPNLDGVVFCAGIVEYLPIKFATKTKIQKIFSVNFDSQVILTQQLLKHKKLNNNSSLIYISSIASKLGVIGTSMYASSKAALNAFMKVTASEVAWKHIRANSICPGVVITPMGETAKSMSSELENDYPLGLGSVSDISGPCIFLLSDASKWITGTEFIIDGGLTLK